MARASTARKEVWLLWDADKIVKEIHPKSQCSGYCSIHKQSDHVLKDSMLSFNDSFRVFTRICQHGNEHHDPDDKMYWLKTFLNAKSSSWTYNFSCKKLNSFPCPNCVCGCCDITVLTRED